MKNFANPISRNGDKYVGEWKDDVKNGHGTLYYNSRDK